MQRKRTIKRLTPLPAPLPLPHAAGLSGTTGVQSDGHPDRPIVYPSRQSPLEVRDGCALKVVLLVAHSSRLFFGKHIYRLRTPLNTPNGNRPS